MIKTTKSEWSLWLKTVSDFHKYHAKVAALYDPHSDDDRLYLDVRILGIVLSGLLDSGSSRTILGAKGIKMLEPLNIPILDQELFSVKVANGQNCKVEGVMAIPIQVGDKIRIVDVLVVPSIAQPLILGLDFWRCMGILPRISNGVRTADVCGEIQMTYLQSKESLTKEDETHLEDLVQRNFHVLSPKLGCTNLVEHKIITSSEEPIKQRYYPLSPAKQTEINTELDNMLRLGVVVPSQSPWSSPALVVDKSDGTKRFVVDYRRLNKITKRDAYPLPYVAAILDRLKEARYLSSLDLKSAYWQVPLEESSRERSAFTIPGRGLFEFTRMPFGLHNSGATWQRLIDRVLGPELEPHVFVYLDDIIVCTPTFEKHLQILEEVFCRLAKANLTLNREKCMFCRSELKYLGYVVDAQGLRVDPGKVDAILNFARPQSVKDVKRFVGMTSWYRRFVPNFATIVGPLTNLTRKNKKFVWSDETEESFVTLKSKLVEAPILCCPDFDLPFNIQTDASNFGLGAVLTQDYQDGEKVVAYASRSLTKNERNYSATEKECLAVIWAIEKFRAYVEGSCFKVITDHHSLVWLNNLKDPTGRLARWSLRLQPYDFEIVHRRGKENVVPDALSRSVQVNLISIIPEIITDRWYLSMKEKVLNQPLSFLNWRVEEDRLFKQCRGSSTWKLVVPKDQRQDVLHECHDDPTAGHLGIYKTYKRISCIYYWPKLRFDVAKYVNRCEICLQYKVEQQCPAGLMGKSKDVSQPWQLISTDIVGPLPRSSHGYRYLLVVADWFTKYTLLFPLRSAVASKIVHHIENDVFLVYGAPQMIICDNGPQYAGKEMKKLASAYESKIFFNARYHPQVNPAERVNRVLKTMLSSYVQENQRRWDINIYKIGFAIRTATHEVTGYSPVFLNFGREIYSSGRMYGDAREIEEVPSSNPRENLKPALNALRPIYEDVKARIDKAYEASAQRYNLRRREVTYRVGQTVYKKNYVQSKASENFSAKLAPKYIGPFTVAKRLSPLVFELVNQQGKSIGYWHVNDLKPKPED